MLLLLPAGAAAQQAFAGERLGKEYLVNQSDIKTNQKSSSEAQFWLYFGPGIGTLGDGAIALIGGITYKWGHNLFTFHVTGVSELFGDEFHGIGLLYGRATSTQSFQFSAAAGLALVNGTRSEGLYGSSESVPTTIGIPVELQAVWEPVNFLGLGIVAFANLNPAQSFAGIMLTLQIGKLR